LTIAIPQCGQKRASSTTMLLQAEQTATALQHIRYVAAMRARAEMYAGTRPGERPERE